MKNIKFIAMMLAFIMMFATLSSIVTLPVLADDTDTPVAETTTEETTEETEDTTEETEEKGTTTNSILSEDYENKRY